MNVNYSGPAKTACLYACKIMTIVLSLAACNYSLRNLGIISYEIQGGMKLLLFFLFLLTVTMQGY